MLIDCDRCEMRDIACGDCVVTTLLSLKVEIGEPERVEIGEPEREALRTLADAGIVPPLRFTQPEANAS